MSKICGNKDCSTSSAIDESLTHGWGHLDELGFWEFECTDPRHQKVDEEIMKSMETRALYHRRTQV